MQNVVLKLWSKGKVRRMGSLTFTFTSTLSASSTTFHWKKSIRSEISSQETDDEKDEVCTILKLL